MLTTELELVVENGVLSRQLKIYAFDRVVVGVCAFDPEEGRRLGDPLSV